MRIAIFSLVIIILAAGPALAHRPGAMLLSPYFNFDAPTATAQKDPAPQVGDQRTFWGWDLSVMPPTDRQFTATCRGVSDFGYVFVEDAHWDLDMNQTDVDAVLSAWDEATPAGSIDPGAGIYDIEPDAIFSKGRQQHRADARGLFCYWAARELNVSLNELAHKLMMTPSGIGYAVARGESIVRNYGYRLAK